MRKLLEPKLNKDGFKVLNKGGTVRFPAFGNQGCFDAQFREIVQQTLVPLSPRPEGAADAMDPMENACEECCRILDGLKLEDQRGLVSRLVTITTTKAGRAGGRTRRRFGLRLRARVDPANGRERNAAVCQHRDAMLGRDGVDDCIRLGAVRASAYGGDVENGEGRWREEVDRLRCGFRFGGRHDFESHWHSHEFGRHVGGDRKNAVQIGSEMLVSVNDVDCSASGAESYCLGHWIVFLAGVRRLYEFRFASRAMRVTAVSSSDSTPLLIAAISALNDSTLGL